MKVEQHQYLAMLKQLISTCRFFSYLFKFYVNYLPTSTGTDAFKLLSDEQVYDFNIDYIKPLKYGRIETGTCPR